MVILRILLCAAVLLTAAGLALLSKASLQCRREDFWDEAVLKRHGFEKSSTSVQDGRRWYLCQNVQSLECMSFDMLRLHANYIEHPQAKGVILLFHGYRSSWKLDFSSVFELYYSLGYSLLICDQRASGESEGRFITFGIRERRDVESWVTCMSQLLGSDVPLILGGLSMGATSVLMASCAEFDGNVRGIIADCGFTSPYAIMDSVEGRFPLPLRRCMLGLLNVFTKLFAGFALKEFSTVEALSQTALPVLLIHGKADTFVPCRMSEEAYAACAGERELILVDGAGHGMSYPTEPERVREAVTAFLRHCTPESC